MTQRTCAHCRGDIPASARRNRIYCSKRCGNAAYRASGRGATPAKQREYGRAAYRRKREALLAAIGERSCQECGTPLPPEARLRRRFCSRSCINRAALREHPEKRLLANQLRRARMKGADSPGVSVRDWKRLIARHGHACAYCGVKSVLTMDHVIPVARGGRHAIGNILPACFPCNSSKRDDLLVYWLHGRAKARLHAS